MKRCEYYDLDCEQEERTCEGCAYNKPVAKTDFTYCINSECATKEELWKCEYLQRSFTYLTDENLDWLEQHCEKTIEHATRNTLIEHLMVLELIKEHKNYLSMREDYLRRMKASNEVLRKQGYISKDKIKEKIEDLRNPNM